MIQWTTPVSRKRSTYDTESVGATKTRRVICRVWLLQQAAVISHTLLIAGLCPEEIVCLLYGAIWISKYNSGWFWCLTSPVSHYRDFWWIMCHWNRFLWVLRFPPVSIITRLFHHSSSPTRCSSQKDTTCRLCTLQCCFGNRGALDRETF